MQWGISFTYLSSNRVFDSETQFYWKNLRPATRKNFSRKISESRTAMWAARPIRELAVLGRAWMTSYRTRLQSLFWSTGSSRFSIISAYTGPGIDNSETGWTGHGLIHLMFFSQLKPLYLKCYKRSVVSIVEQINQSWFSTKGHCFVLFFSFFNIT